MEIVNYPHPALRWKSVPVTKINKKIRDIVAEMFDLMYAANGIGLAANQVALPYRLFVINPTGDRNEADHEQVFLNPAISKRQGQEEGEEGCLSLPGLYGPVRRPAKVVIEAFDLKGQPFQMELDELQGRVVQHETDHLDGILFPDRMTETALKTALPALEEFEIEFRGLQQAGQIPADDELERELKLLQTEQE